MWGRKRNSLWRVEIVFWNGSVRYVPPLDRMALDYGHAKNLKYARKKRHSDGVSFMLVRDGEETYSDTENTTFVTSE